MNRQFVTCIMACAAIAVALIGVSDDAFAQSNARTKAKKAQMTMVRAQNADAQVVKVNSVLADEEIFDRDLDPSARFNGPSTAPNCINVFDPNRSTPINPVSPEMSQQAPPVPPSADASQQPTSQTPPPVTSLAAGQGASTAMSYAPAFLGDFFGVPSGTGGGATVAEFAQARDGSNNFYQLTSLGGANSHLLQTTGGPFSTMNSTDPQHLNGTLNIPGYTGLTLALVSGGKESVLFNPPANGHPPNPQFVNVYDAVTQLRTGGLDPAYTTGRTKLAEGSSPIPRDRVFFNYSYFADAQLTQTTGVNVSRYTPGFEKTFFNGNASVEVRMPFASTLTTNLDAQTGVSNPTDLTFGNLTLYTKALLYQNTVWATSAGLGFTLPTANNINVYDGKPANGNQLLHISNDSVHLMPFLGGVYTPNDRFYTQGLCQFDFDTNGNRVASSTDLNGKSVPNLQNIGIYRDSTFIYVSASAGYWLYKSQTPGFMGITGFSPLAELHYNRNLQNGNVINGNATSAATGIVNTIYGAQYTNVEVLNAVVGSNILFGRDKILSLGYTTPLGMGVDKQFAGEFRLMFNWYFGGGNSSPLTRVGGAQF